MSGWMSTEPEVEDGATSKSNSMSWPANRSKNLLSEGSSSDRSKKRRYIQMLMKKSELTFSNNQFVALHLMKSVQIIQILSRCQVNG